MIPISPDSAMPVSGPQTTTWWSAIRSSPKRDLLSKRCSARWKPREGSSRGSGTPHAETLAFGMPHLLAFRTHPTAPGVRTTLEDLAPKHAKARTAKAGDFIEPRFVKELDGAGLTRRLSGQWRRLSGCPPFGRLTRCSCCTPMIREGARAVSRAPSRCPSPRGARGPSSCPSPLPRERVRVRVSLGFTNTVGKTPSRHGESGPTPSPDGSQQWAGGPGAPRQHPAPAPPRWTPTARECGSLLK